MTDDTRLLAALAVIQARGAIGERSLTDAVRHADRFVAQVPVGPQSIVDLGSGGGLPALVIAWRRADVTMTMIERRATRADLLRRAVIALDLGERCTVRDVDVAAVCEDSPGTFDVVTSRSFGDIATTTRFAERLLSPGGVALISEPPTDRSDQWAVVLARHRSLADEGVEQGIRILRCS
jgi:16S rRNA (guanine527-N7)-methyltransferase